MGFKIPRKTARLQFEGEEFEGCEIICALEVTFEAQEELERLQKAEDHRAALSFFADNCIISWNLEDAGGEPMLVSGDSFYKFPGWFGVLVLNGWAEAVKEASKVDAPLGEPSKNGSTSEEESVMTAASSAPLPSSSVPNS